MDLLERLLTEAKRLGLVSRSEHYRLQAQLILDAHEAIEQLRAQVQMLGEEPVA